MQGILGCVEEDAPGPLHGEAAQAGRAGGDRDGEVECEEGFAAVIRAVSVSDVVANRPRRRACSARRPSGEIVSLSTSFHSRAPGARTGIGAVDRGG